MVVINAPALLQATTINSDSNHTVRVEPVSTIIPTTDNSPSDAISKIVDRKALSVVNFLRLCSRIMSNCGAVHCDTNGAVVVTVVPKTVAAPVAKIRYKALRISTRSQQSNNSVKRNQKPVAITPPVINPATSSEYPSKRLTTGWRSMMHPDKRYQFLKQGHEQQPGWHRIFHQSRPEKGR